MDIYTLIGLTGVVAYVGAYALLQFGMLDGNGIAYNLINIAAASLVLISLTSEFNLASAIIQVTWITIGVTGMALRLYRSRQSQPISPPEPGTVRPASSSLGLRADTGPIGRTTVGLRADLPRASAARSH